MSEYICAECLEVCESIPKRELQVSEHFGQVLRTWVHYHESDCCAGNVLNPETMELYDD